MDGDVAEIVGVVGICVFCASSFLSTYTPNAALKVGNVGRTS